MKNLIKKLFPILPKWIRLTLYKVYEDFFTFVSYIKIRNILLSKKVRNNQKKNILFYHTSGLSFGGTEKSLQIIAKTVDKNKYNVYFMYSPKPVKYSNGNMRLDGRKSYLENSGVNFIEFDFDTIGEKYPFIIKNQKPDIFSVIKDKKIDMLFTAGSGYSTFPTNLIRNIPIIMMNIFGAPSTQKNIAKHICISEEVRGKILPIVNKEKTEMVYIQSELPPPNMRELGEKVREKFNIKKSDMVFGRIGRPDNGIFDPIGINAFKKVLVDYPNTHYIIMAPPPILVEKVKNENIKNVHFIEPSAKEEDVWAFHGSINVLAHFRYDGESFGLNIAESMLAGNPIISHKSPIWNAHLEYLDDSFSRITEIGDVEKYAEYMKFMIKQHKENKLKEMGQKAKEKAEKLFYIKNNIEKIEKIIDKIPC